ncbi:hypothetical protein KM043_005414 [Ampulex compressa]|nr:hypothetical protein KM043_005414 [Ampulex compressa]
MHCPANTSGNFNIEPGKQGELDFCVLNKPKRRINASVEPSTVSKELRSVAKLIFGSRCSGQREISGTRPGELSVNYGTRAQQESGNYVPADPKLSRPYANHDGLFRALTTSSSDFPTEKRGCEGRVIKERLTGDLCGVLIKTLFLFVPQPGRVLAAVANEDKT